MTRTAPSSVRDLLGAALLALLVVDAIVVVGVHVVRATMVPSWSSLPELIVRPVQTLAMRMQLPSIGSKSRLLLVGDIMLGRYVETLMSRHGASYPFTFVGSMLSSPDLTIANLEGPLDPDHAQTLDDSLVFSFSPTTAALLADQGIDVVSLANNHSFDQGTESYAYTRTALEQAGIASVGHPEEIGDLSHTTVQVGEKDVHVFAFTSAVNPSFDTTAAIDLVRRHAARDSFDLVFIHWGTEYAPLANAAQRALAHAFIDAGADAVIGHHPHVVQDAELYADRLIVYSLGNFVFDQYFSRATQQELALQLSIMDGAVRYDFLPLESMESQPQILTEQERTAALRELEGKSPTLSGVETGYVTLQWE